MKEKTKPRKRTKTAKEPERLKITGDWEAAVASALRKPKPAKGWPK